MAKYDVIKDYDWTSMPRGSPMRGKAPRVWVKSYKLISNQIMHALQGFIAIGTAADAKQFYEKLYSEATTPEDDFNFPFFDDNIRSFSNSFGDTFQDGIGGSGGVAGALFSGLKGVVGEGAQYGNLTDTDALANAASSLRGSSGGDMTDRLKGAMSSLSKGGHPGTYIETPKFYEFNSTSDDALKVSFALSNTINSDGPEKNHNLIQRLTYINRPLRVNNIAVDPPRIYQVKVPGHRFIKWAYCESFSVSFIGTRRTLNGVVTPEGYLIDMSFKSLTLEHAGFMKDAAE